MDTTEFCIHPRSQPVLDWIRSRPLPGPLLITGVEAMGKRTLALQLAKRTLCQFHRITPCDCPSCVAMENGANGDLLTIGEENDTLTIEMIRTIRSHIAQTSLNPHGRVILVFHSQRLTNEASNALLKCIEEPIGNTYWILTALHGKQLPPTLLSRLYRLRLPRIPDSTIVQWALTVLQSQHVSEQLQEIAGRPGIARSIHDKSSIMNERREHVLALTESLWGDGDTPTLDKDSTPIQELLNELFEHLQQSAKKQTMPWDVWVERLQGLDEVREALGRHQSIDQIIRYAKTQ